MSHCGAQTATRRLSSEWSGRVTKGKTETRRSSYLRRASTGTGKGSNGSSEAVTIATFVIVTDRLLYSI